MPRFPTKLADGPVLRVEQVFVDDEAIELPDGVIGGAGIVTVLAHAWQWRPQDCAPRMRAILFGTNK